MVQALDPGEARTLSEFIVALRELKASAGNPSISQITKRIHHAWQAAGRPAAELPVRSTVGHCFQHGRRRVNEDLMIAVVEALVAGDRTTAIRWREALRVITRQSEHTTFVTALDHIPADLAQFAGRVEALERATNLVRAATAGAVVAFEGMAGVGKTSLAIHLGHRLVNAGRGPATALFVNLRGFDATAPPADPGAVQEAFLRLLGVRDDQIPHDVDARTALYRERAAAARALVVLDNAATADQVWPLLPRSATCVTMVTSRHTLPGLECAQRIVVEVFTEREALDLLRRTAGDSRVNSDPSTARHIAELLGHLPLALSIIGSHMRHHPDWLLTDYVSPLRALAMEGGVRATLAVSDRTLPTGPRRLLRLMVLHPGGDIDAHAAAALMDQDLTTTSRQLDALTAAHLVQRRTSGRYQLHDLVSIWAVERVTIDEPASRVTRALTRLYAHYRYHAATAMDVLYPHEKHRRPQVDPPESAVADLAVAEVASAWLETEQANLLAVARHAVRNGGPSYAIDLNDILWRHLETTGRYSTGLLLCQEAVAGAKLRADRSAETRTLINTGVLWYRLGEHGRALTTLRQALAIARDEDDHLLQGRATTNIGVVHLNQSQFDAALEYFTQSLAIFRKLGDRLGMARSFSNIIPVYIYLGRYQEALDHLEIDIKMTRDAGDRPGEGVSLGNRGLLYNRLGRYDEALGCLREAIQLHREAGHRIGEGLALDDIGLAYQGLGRYADALDYHRRAVDILREAGFRAGEGVALNSIGLAYQGQGRHAYALTYHRRALQIHREHGDRPQETAALNCLGEALRHSGLMDEATDVHLAALAQAEALGDRYEQARAHTGLGHLHQAPGRIDDASHHWRRALRLFTDLHVPEARELGEWLPRRLPRTRARFPVQRPISP